MEKITYTAIAAQPAKKVRRSKTVCDFCEKVALARCCLCKRDTCYGLRSSHARSDPRDYGDYPARYCPECYALKFEGYFDKEYNKMQRRHEMEEEELERRIVAVALKFKEEQT